MNFLNKNNVVKKKKPRNVSLYEIIILHSVYAD